jgi:serine/threonine protein kinase
MIGEVVGSYRITGQIAVGGMGVVYLAEHQLIGKQVAVKLLRREFSTNHQVIDRFFNEARATTVIRHPGIVDIFDYGWHGDGRAYIVMEYIEGETLKQRIEKRGILPLESAMRIVRSVAGAVGAAHAQGIIHRDLKPDNIFLVPDPEMPGGERVKVLDFGLAKLTEDQGASLDTQAGIVLGTPTYMSPEQCDGDGNIDHRADQYALGCILYELLCGRPPFASDSPMELFKAHRFQAPAPPRTLVPLIPVEVEHVILKLLSKSRDRRFPNMDQVRIALDNSLTPEADMDTLTAEVPDPNVTPPPAAPPPYASGTVSSLSGSSGQVVSAPVGMPMSGPMNVLNAPVSTRMNTSMRAPMGVPQRGAMLAPPQYPTGSLVARPVRLPSIPGTMRRATPIYWALAGLASILIGFGIVYLATSLLDEPAVLLPPEGQEDTEPAAAGQPEAADQPGSAEQPGDEATETAPPAPPADLAATAPDARLADEPGAAAPGDDDAMIEMEPDEPASPPGADTPAASPSGADMPAASPSGAQAPAASPSSTGTAPGQAAPARPSVPAAPALVDVALELRPPGAKVTVDGQVRAERPLRLAPRPRPYLLVVTAPGFQRKEISVRVDRAKSVRVELEPEKRGIDL